MEFRDLKKQYQVLKNDIDLAVKEVLEMGNYISGKQVGELEKELAEYVGVKHCITCANGTDALTLAVMTWNLGSGDAVFVPDFTFFSTGEIVSYEGATPIFVDVDKDTFNMSAESLEAAIKEVLEEGKLTPKAMIPVDLFGLPADYAALLPIADKYGLKVLEDGAQGFGGEMLYNGEKRKACSFGDIATTSFFPAKPLGCYGDGGAIFTNDDDTAALLQSLRVHGKNGADKYDNIRIGMNSRLDTIQAAILQVKLKAFKDYEVEDVNKVASWYDEALKDINLKLPVVRDGFVSSWAQYTIQLPKDVNRNELQKKLREVGIPTMVYYMKPMHLQGAFKGTDSAIADCSVTEQLCENVLSLPMHPYMKKEDVDYIMSMLKEEL